MAHAETIVQGQQHVFGREVLVVQLASGLVGGVEQSGEVATQVGVAAVGLREAAERFLGGVAQGG